MCVYENKQEKHSYTFLKEKINLGGEDVMC